MSEKNKVQICITLKPELAEKLTNIAWNTGRTRSGLCGWLLESALKEKGLTRPEGEKPPRNKD